MVKAWYLNTESSDPRLENHLNPPEFLTVEELYKKTGVELFKVNVDSYATDSTLVKIKQERSYTYEDDLDASPECMTKYATEHLHTHEETRLVLAGSAYFNVRDGSDRWIRIAAAPGDLIVIPSGIYHGFNLDTNNFVRLRRFFIDSPVWTSYNRPADDMECRKEYVKKLENGFVAAC